LYLYFENHYFTLREGLIVVNILNPGSPPEGENLPLPSCFPRDTAWSTAGMLILLVRHLSTEDVPYSRLARTPQAVPALVPLNSRSI